MKKGQTAKDVNEYIAGFPEHTQGMLKQLRQLILHIVPEAEESISYQMPAYKYHGVLIYFAGYDHHIGIYPGASGVEEFKERLSHYKTSKGTVQFPLDKPLPEDLIAEIIRYRVKVNTEKKHKAK